MSVPKELEMQGLHFGLFLPWVQINSWFSMMQPFYYDEPEQNIYRDYVQLRYNLMPYIYSAALEGALKGLPIVRSMPLMFPDDRNVDDMCYQYMFGDNLCVGIFSNEIYLPAGTWIDAWTGERIESRGETFTRSCPANRAGLLYIRDGAILPCQPKVQHIGTAPFETLVLRAFPAGKSSYTLYEDDGDSYGYEKGAVASTLMESEVDGDRVLLTVHPAEGTYEGMPGTRNYRFELALTRQPLTVKADGKEMSEWRFGKDGLLHFNIGGKAVDQPLQVEVSLGKETGIVPAGVFGKTGLPDPSLAVVSKQFTAPAAAGKPRVIPVEALQEEVIY
jgi:alpha-glucosidase (family GH31 glycosyl hydrolase)